MSWICQVSKYTRVLNMPWLHHGDNSWLHRVQKMPEYSWIIPEYAWICWNIPEYAYIFLNDFVTYFKVCNKVWRNMRLLFEEIKFDFFIEPGSICFVFCYRVNSFVRFINCCYLLGAMNLDILWQDSEAPLTCITFYIIIFGSDILFRSIKKMFSIF